MLKLTLPDVLESEFVQLARGRDGESPDEYLKILDDADDSLKHKHILGKDDARYRDLRSPHLEALKIAESLRDRPSGDPERKAAEERAETLEQPRLARLMKILRGQERVALCLSGGGIRSATFGLGILQGLSHHSLLSQIDYLSTVSGGGYIGSWLTAWRTRVSKEQSGEPSGQPSGQPSGEPSDAPAPLTPIEVIEASLKAKPAGTLDGERPEIEHLRSYSNYLSPQPGILSADTWTLVATVIRNMFLNWMILVPILAAVLLVPKLALHTLEALPRNQVFLMTLLEIGSIAAIAAVIGIGSYLPSLRGIPCNQDKYLWTVLFPLSISAILLSTFWAAWIRAGFPLEAWQFILFGAALHFLGWFGIPEPGARNMARVKSSKGYERYFAAMGAKATKVATTSEAWLALPAIVTGAAGGWAASALGTADTFNPAHHPERVVCLGFPMVMLIYFFAAGLLIGFTSKKTNDEDREWWARSGGWILIVASAWAAASTLVLGGPILIHWAGAKISAAGGVVGLLSGVLGSLGGMSAKTDGTGDKAEADKDKPAAVFSSKWFLNLALKVAPAVFLIALLLAISVLADFVVKTLDKVIEEKSTTMPELAQWLSHKDLIHVVVVLAMIGIAAWIAHVMSQFVNVNTFSLHAMYRSRLIRAYLGAARSQARMSSMNQFTGFDEADNIRMHNIPPGKPLHVLNLCLNLVHGKRLAWQERKAETFTISRLHAGSARVGYQTSDHYGDSDGVSLGTAMAISGAAASPNMGYHSSPLLTFLMTFFNARLGWWLANPGYPGEPFWSQRGPDSARDSLIAEALGNTDDENPYVYLSDGGHFENLGLYEMILRRCKTIIVVDAGGDPDYQFEDLANAIRKIRVDLGVSIHFDKPLAMHRGPVEGNVHCAIANIHYECIDDYKPVPGSPHVDDSKVDGILVYIKPVLDPTLSVDLDQYHSTHPDFPQQSTANQFFDESQFESYRRLGVEILDNLCEEYSQKKEAEQEKKPRQKEKHGRPKMTIAEFVAEAQAYSIAPPPEPGKRHIRTQC